MIIRKHSVFILGLSLACLVGKSQFEKASVATLQAKLNSSKNDSIRASYLISLSLAYLDKNKLDSSLWAARSAKTISLNAGFHGLTAWADQMIATTCYYKGNYDEGIRMANDVIDQAKKINSQLLQANAEKMIGWMYTEISKEKEALKLFKNSLPVFKKYSKVDIHKNVGLAYYGIATSYYYLEKYDSSLLYYDSTIIAQPSLDKRELALAYADRSAVYRKRLINLNKAKDDAMGAVKILENELSQNDAQAYVMAELAATLFLLKDFRASEYWAIKAFDQYQLIPVTMRYTSVYKVLTETFQGLSNFKYAFLSEQQNRILQDSLYQRRKVQIIEDLHIKYETEKKNTEIANLNLDRIRQETLLFKNRAALWIGGITLTMLLGFGFVYYRKREKYFERIRSLEAAQQIRLEKERIAKDLHDSLGSKLSTISLSLQRAVAEKPNDSLSAIQEMIDKAMNELRDSIWGLNKDSISLEELEQRVNSLFWQYRKVNIPVELEMKVIGKVSSIPLSPDTGIHLYRIIQEVVQNSIKHSGAGKVQVTLLKGMDILKLNIQDDGKGFQWPPEVKDEHFGLTNIQKRATMMNAKFNINSTIGQGTLVSITVPIKKG